jgi:hypothetical protein
MPPIEVFVGLDHLGSGSETTSSELPSRAKLKAWVAEHDKIEKETEIFDAGEFRKLKKFTKGPSFPHSAVFLRCAHLRDNLQPLPNETFPPQTPI